MAASQERSMADMPSQDPNSVASNLEPPISSPKHGSSRVQKGKTPLHAIETSKLHQKTFFDDATPIDNLRSEEGETDRSRDSHDLSYSNTVRNSIMDNMLMSLGDLPNGASAYPGHSALYSSTADDDFYTEKGSFSAPGTRVRGHTYNTSFSSDYDFRHDDASIRASDRPRGRRSNSSSNFPGPLHRARSSKDTQIGVLRGNGDIQQGGVGEMNSASHVRGSGKKGSKSSGSSSVDYGYSQVIGTTRLGNRSTSFDHGFGDGDRDRISRSSPQKAVSSSMLERGRPLFPSYDESAPEPTVRAGPRRLQEVPQSPLAHAPSNSADLAFPARKESLRGSPARKPRKTKAQPIDTAAVRAQAESFYNASTGRELPAVPAYQDPSAPSPTVALRKPSVVTSAAPNAPKEKPGFFRRVFGSSKTHQPTNSDASQVLPMPLHQEAAGVEQQTTRPKTQPNQQHISAQLKALPKPPDHEERPTSRDLYEQPQPAPVLHKKPSSFFRRRKKSVSEQTRPPPVPMQLAPSNQGEVPKALPSPSMSSLRKVMGPYLGEAASPAERYYDSREVQPPADENDETIPNEGYPAGKSQRRDTSEREANPDSRSGATDSAPSSRGEAVKQYHSTGSNSPKLKLKIKRRPARPHDDSFLADSSGNEDRSAGVPSNDRSPTFGLPADPKRPKTSPTSPAFAMRSRENETPQRKANTSEKRRDMLAPNASDKERPSSAEPGEDGWIVPTPPHRDASVHTDSSRSHRVWLEPTSSEERLDEPGFLSLPLEGSRIAAKFSPASETASPITTSDVFQSATSLPIVQVESDDAVRAGGSQASEVPSAELYRRAEKMFDGDESVVPREEAAAMLGEATVESSLLRTAYLELFDWSGCNIVLAMRDLCSRLILRAETQQVDRLLAAFAQRWCQCNPSHGFKSPDVVHTISYSVILLNTDLHLADIESKMTRTQYVKNTLPSVRRVAAGVDPEREEETIRKTNANGRGAIPWLDQSGSNPSSPKLPPVDIAESSDPFEGRRPSVRPVIRTDSDMSSTLASASSDTCNVLVKAPFDGNTKGWEFQIEIVLKEFYNSIRQQRLPLHGPKPYESHDQQQSNSSLTVGNLLRRTPSVLSKTPSDTTSFRGRSEYRSATGRWTSKTRSARRAFYPSSTVGSSRTSLDDGSVFSPAGSSTWSKHSFGRTQTTMSMESLGSRFTGGDYQQSIGFANALSHAIIREEGNTIASSEDFSRVASLLEDESLELVGAPWAKEGMVKHKHHLEAMDKKSKDRSWNECFAVVEKGYFRLFSFSTNTKSQRLKAKQRPQAPGGVVGGGNWMENAESLGSFPLRQTIASALPPPGYSKQRPHVFALSLPTGAVHLFQVGTPDIVKEFVSTANYWSARLSKEPLAGGVSNIEYGWSENVINPALIRQDSSPSNNVNSMPRPSIQSSIRSSIDQQTGVIKPRLPGDKVNISDWQPPAQSMMASNLMEVDQLKGLIAYVKNVEDDLSHHNELRAPMLIAFSPRHPNAAKAMANWEKKSSHLLREIVKFRTYIDALTQAQTMKDRIYAEREAEAETEADKHSNLDADAEISRTNSAISAAQQSEDVDSPGMHPGFDYPPKPAQPPPAVPTIHNS